MSCWFYLWFGSSAFHRHYSTFPRQPLPKAAADKCSAHALLMMNNGDFQKWIPCQIGLRNAFFILRTNIFIGIPALIQFPFQKHFGTILPAIPVGRKYNYPTSNSSFTEKIKAELILKNSLKFFKPHVWKQVLRKNQF